MRTITVEQFHAELKAQGVPMEDLAFRCPMCGTIQSARDLIEAGAGASYEEVEKYLAFSCVGRWRGSPSGFKEFPAGYQDGCDWTLGGLITACQLVVITPDRKSHHRFEPCSAEEAKRHAERKGMAVGAKA